MYKFTLYCFCCFVIFSAHNAINGNDVYGADPIKLSHKALKGAEKLDPQAYKRNTKIIALLNKENIKFPISLKEAIEKYNLVVWNPRINGIILPDPFEKPREPRPDYDVTLMPKGAPTLNLRVGDVHVLSSENNPAAESLEKCVYIGDCNVDKEVIFGDFIAKYGQPYYKASEGEPVFSSDKASAIHYLIKADDSYLEFIVEIYQEKILIYRLDDRTKMIEAEIDKINKSEKTTKQMKDMF